MMVRKYGTKTNTYTKEVLQELGDKVQAAAEKALQENAEKLVAAMKSKAPHNTGNLLNSIKYKQASKKNTLDYKIIVDAQGKNGYKYARLLEFSPRIRKQPFMYPAFDELRDGMKEHIKEAIKKAVTK